MRSKGLLLCLLISLFYVLSVRADCTIISANTSSNPFASCTGTVTITGTLTIDNSYDISGRTDITSIVIDGTVFFAGNYAWTLPPNAILYINNTGNILYTDAMGGCNSAKRIIIGSQVATCTGVGANAFGFDQIIEAGGFSNAGPLPIELLSFAGKRVDNTIQLHWVTASEQNNDYMEVQRSENGKTFARLGTVPGRGDSYEQIAYSYVDERPLPGVNYYRLRQVDFDGKEEYHKVIAVLFKDKEEKAQGITLFPTVVSEQLNFALHQEAATNGEYYISDLSGRVLLRQPFEQGMQQQSIPVHRLPRGQYILTVQTGREMQVARFVKE